MENDKELKELNKKEITPLLFIFDLSF